MKGFRAYLQSHPEGLPRDLSGGDLAEFHYGEWLLQRGFEFKDDQGDAPLFYDYLRFQREQITRYFKELADHARDYARSQDREVLVSGNFFNLQDHYLPLEPSVDVIVTEMRNTAYKQPAWYRYAAGFGRGKPIVVVENPYGGVVPELVRDLKQGKSHDLLRMAMYEAAALGANMSVPYGAWMGSVIEDSFWPPHDVCAEVQQWLAEHEHLFGHRTMARTAVVFSTESNFLLESRDRALADNTRNLTRGAKLPFWSVCELLSNALQPYDVVILPDGLLRPDDISPKDLAGYGTVVLPHCHVLTEQQCDALIGYLESGGRVVYIGPVGTNVELGSRIASHSGAVELRSGAWTLDEIVGAPQVRVSEQIDAALNLQRVPKGVTLHLIRYDFDRSLDVVPSRGALTLEVDLAGQYDDIASFGAPKPPYAELERSGLTHRVRLTDVPLYAVVLLGGPTPAGR